MLKNAEEGKYSQYVMQTLQCPQTGDEAFQQMYNRFAKRILRVDKPVFPFSIVAGAEYNGGAYK